VYTEREDEAGRSGWIVSRVSQEHGVLRWEGDASKCNRLEVGDKLLVWPNHACIASAHFPNYLVVDSDREGEEYTVCDVWQRWRGW
jgi:D-serine deaminase-like pyridoxal phosphate-dependent protein